MESELWKKTDKINELEHVIENLQLHMKQIQLDFNDISKRKDETIANLEQNYYNKKDSNEIKKIKDENKRLENDLQISQLKIIEMTNLAEEKNRIIEKNMIIHDFYEKLKKENEEVIQ